MNNLYRILTNKGYTVQQVDEILWRISHRLSIKCEEQEEIVEYINEYVKWNLKQDQPKNQ